MLFANEREIWICHIGQNIGTEQYGKGEKFTRNLLDYKEI